MSPLITKKGLGFAGIAVLGACAACCALPLLTVVGVGGGTLSAFAGYIRPGAELIVMGAVGIALLAIVAFRARARRAAACDIACKVDCGCGPVDKVTTLFSASSRAGAPIVCTADLHDKPTVQAQLDGYRTAFEQLLRVEQFECGVRWVFTNRPGLGNHLRILAQNEHRCCSFFKFDLRETGDTIVWETSADQGAARVLEEYARLPERLTQHARGSEVQPIKEAISGAGLSFAADVPGLGSSGSRRS